MGDREKEKKKIFSESYDINGLDNKSAIIITIIANFFSIIKIGFGVALICLCAYLIYGMDINDGFEFSFSKKGIVFKGVSALIIGIAGIFIIYNATNSFMLNKGKSNSKN